MITKGSKLQRKNIPGLTYHPDQAPSGTRDFPKNNNWKTVIRPPTETSKTPFVFKIEIRNPAKGKKLGTLLSVVLVKFLSEDGVPPRVRNASTYFLNTHSNVRVTDHETGVMVPIGERYDPRSYRNVNYQTCSKKQKQCQQFVLSEREQHLSLLDFNELFLKSSIWFAQSLCSSINNLKAHNHVLKVTRDEVKFSLLPTYMCSSSLHNSVHIDASDFTASFSIFYQEKLNTGLSFLVFPDISLAVELSKPVLVRWEGDKMKHCTITVNKGITSMFGSAKKITAAKSKSNIEFQFPRKRSKVNQLSVGDDVFVRQKTLSLSDVDKYLLKFPSHSYSVRAAKVLAIHSQNITVEFESMKTIDVVTRNNVLKKSTMQ